LRGKALAATVAILLMVLGVGVLGGTYFLDNVKVSNELAFPSTTTVRYSDGTPMARLGEVTRYELKYEDMSDAVVKSIVASEDQTFWTNEGRRPRRRHAGGLEQLHRRRNPGCLHDHAAVRPVGVRAGGGHVPAEGPRGRDGWKMSKSMTKEKILESYLNSVSFGRQAYGIEAAAHAFFGKSAAKSVAPEFQLTWAEAVVLVAMVKQPYPDPADPQGHPGYDPTVSPEAEASARQRFDYVREQLVEMSYLSRAEADKLVFPMDTIKPYVPEINGLDAPTGLVVNHVLSELTHTPGSYFYGAKDWKFLREGGYQIYTTINKGCAGGGRGRGRRHRRGQPDGRPAGQPAGGAGRDPARHRSGAGLLRRSRRQRRRLRGLLLRRGRRRHRRRAALGRIVVQGVHLGRRAQGRLLAAVLLGLEPARHARPDRCQPDPERQHVRQPQGRRQDAVLVLDSTIYSLNVPFYQVTLSVSPAKVLQMARDAGIDYMWTDDLERRDLRACRTWAPRCRRSSTPSSGSASTRSPSSTTPTGWPRWPAGGLRANAHFVQTVLKGDQVVYGETLPRPDQARIMSPQNINDLTYAMQQVSSAKLNIGWDTAGKTGTWEYGPKPTENAHAWMVGFDRKIAAAVWVGNKAEEQPIRDKKNTIIYGAGVPAEIWRAFMTNATAAMNEPKQNTKFNAPNFAGTTNPPGSVEGPRGGIFGRDPEHHLVRSAAGGNRR
jgi:membrane peptidoglycan carboxypeptidase